MKNRESTIKNEINFYNNKYILTYKIITESNYYNKL
jgi:hypothetical protein